MNSSDNPIQVSVCVVTYNQENYIIECLDSLVSQHTNFKFEIVIGEDASTDNTRAIVQRYVEKYPDLIVPIFHEKNVGAGENVKQVYEKARGKYIAHVDGDDMALPNKLQKQFDILEANPDCNLCSHDVKQIEADGKLRRKIWTYPEGKYDLFDFYKKLPFFAHSSKMFVNKYNSEFWDKIFHKPYALDIDIHVAQLEDGHIYHIGEALGVYRIGSGMSAQDAKFNELLPLASERVFEKGLVLFKEDKEKLATIRDLYALAMLQCAYSYAIYDKDSQLFNLYVNKSIQQSSIGIKQKIFKVATFCPSIFFRLFLLRSKIRQL